MGHQITETDKMFSTRMPTWHGLEIQLPDYPTREQAQKLVHPWEPITETLYRRVPSISATGELTESYVEVESVKLNTRSDNGEELGAVSSTFVTVNNNELWDVAEAVQGEGADVLYETGGSLSGGAKVWVLLRLNEPIEIKGDPNGAVLPYYALQNSHDGSGSFRGQSTMTRIVCANTAQMADLDAQARGTEFTFRHSKNVRDRIEEARAALAGWRESIEDFRLFSEHLISMTVDEETAIDFMERFIPMPPPAMASERVRNNVREAQNKWWSVYSGPTTEGLANAYGLVQASVEYAEHYRKARSAESRFRRSWLDRNTIVRDAVELALTAAGESH